MENKYIQYDVPRKEECIFNINNQKGLNEFLISLIQMNAVTLEGLELICEKMLLPKYLIEQYKNMYINLNMIKENEQCGRYK